MAYEIPGQQVTLPASTTILSTTSLNWQYRLVTIDSSGRATAPVGSSGGIFGVLQNKPLVLDEAASIMIDGLSKIQAAGSTVHAGHVVSAATDGMVEALAAGDYAVGRIVAGSSGSTGRILTMSIEPIGTT